MRRALDVDQSISSPPCKVVATAGQILPDGRMLEMVREQDGSSQLAAWAGNAVTITGSFECGDTSYVPLSLRKDLLKAIRFAPPPRAYSSTAEIVNKIADIVDRYCPSTEDTRRLISLWILSTWFSDILPKRPRLVVSGPSPAEVDRSFCLLQCMCRRGMVVADCNVSGLRALMALQPTILMAEFNWSRSVIGFLRAAGGEGVSVTQGGDALDLCCCCALHSLDGDIHPSLAAGSLAITLLPSQDRVPWLDRNAQSQIAAEIQPLCLAYRFNNHVSVRDSRFDAPDLSTESRELARGLGAPIVGDEALADEVRRLLAVPDQGLRERRTRLPEFAIISVVLGLLHQGQVTQISVQRIATLANDLLHANGEILEYSAEEIGHRLARLQISTSRSGPGKNVPLTRDLSQIVHQLKNRYEIKTFPEVFEGCPDCNSPDMQDL